MGGDGDQERYLLDMRGKLSPEGGGQMTSGGRTFQAEGTAYGNAEERRTLQIQENAERSGKKGMEGTGATYR